MDRNIITWRDEAQSRRSGSERVEEDPAKTLDNYWARLAKYVPIEMISAYMLMKGALESAYKASDTSGRLFLGGLTALGIVGTWFFAKRVLRVIRWQQCAVSSLAFLVWVFATGGVFASFSLYMPWMTTAAVVFFGVTAKIVDLPPLPMVDS